MEAIKKPASVIVFGILNILFGIFGLVVSTFILFPSFKQTLSAFKIWQLVMKFLGFCFDIWLVVLGIGLLRLKNWARRGSILYACLVILVSVIATGVEVLAIFLHWTTIPQSGQRAYILGMCIGFIGPLIYPVLLLIFMQTAKIRQAFQSISMPD